MSDQSIGSLDHFEDIKEQLDKLGVIYVLAIGQPGQKFTRIWSNYDEFPEPAKQAVALKAALIYHLSDPSNDLPASST
jgi:hypothetical protein